MPDELRPGDRREPYVVRSAQLAGGRTVTLLDAWGAGHSRATSGDETRITRAAHGADPLYARWSRRALTHWQVLEEEWGLQLVEPSGVLWFGGRDAGFEARSAETFTAESIPHEWLTPDEVGIRWPQIDPHGLVGALSLSNSNLIAVSAKVGGASGIQVFSAQGKHLGTIPVSRNPNNLAFAGPDKKTLYIVARGAVYRVAMLAEGYKGRAK